jgi:membrane-anchored mycosin MYCP
MRQVMRAAAWARPARLAGAVGLAAMVALAPAAARASAGHLTAGTGCAGPSSRVFHGTPWAQAYLDASEVRSFTTGAGQVIAVVDTGVSASAPALAGAVLPGASMVGSGAGDTDCLGEGTFVAGLIAAGPIPGAGLAGLAPGARILPVAVTSASGIASSQAVAAGIGFAARHGASVIDVSLATPPGPSAALQAAVAYAQSRNVVVVAGIPSTQALTGSAADTVGYPAAYPGVVAVSAVNQASSPVSTAAPGVRVDLAAPGTNLVSVAPAGHGNITASGAGLASGLVAATAALVRSYYPRLSATQVIQRLEATADGPGTGVPDPQVGYGILDPYAALTDLLPQEWGVRAPPLQAAPAPRLPTRPARSSWPLVAAVAVAATSVVLVAGLAAAVHVVRHGRSRRCCSSAWQ